MDNSYFCVSVLFFLLLEISWRSTDAQSTVKYLPGFDGPLPFELETGYIGVDESEVQFFYFFLKSENNPKKDPLILWSSGGPGCSAFYGLVYEIGPLQFRPVKYNGSLPTLVLNPNSWSKIANIIFLDFPVGTGFSYGKTPAASISNNVQSSHQAYQFLQKWLIGHPEYISNPTYIAGDSYVGLTVPIITQIISDENEIQTNQYINLQGYILGNPGTYRPEERNFEIPFARGMGLISEELYQSLMKSCRGEYQYINSDNLECLANMEAYKKCISKINTEHILEPFTNQSHICDECFEGRQRVLSEKFIKLHEDEGYHLSLSFVRDDGHVLSNYWMNDKSVQNALHIRTRTVNEWIWCNYDIPFTTTENDTREYHVNLSKKGYRSLIYSGDHDMVVTFLSTQAWIRNLNYSIVDDWRVWSIDDGESVAGYTRTYSNNMTYATIKGAGHTAPEYKPVECYMMFKRWMSGQSL